MDSLHQDEWALGVALSAVLGGGVVLAALLAVVLAPLAPWLGSSTTALASGPPMPCSAATSAAVLAASPLAVSAASLSLRCQRVQRLVRVIAGYILPGAWSASRSGGHSGAGDGGAPA